MSISWSKRPPLSRVAHWDRWARNGPVGSFRDPEMMKMIPNGYRTGRVQVGKEPTVTQNDSKMGTGVGKGETKTTSTTTDASKSDIEASKPPKEILNMAKLVSVAQTGVKRLEGLARDVDAKAEAEIAQMDEEIRMLAMQVRKLDMKIKKSEVKTSKSKSKTTNAKTHVMKGKAKYIKDGSANVKVKKDVSKDGTVVHKASEVTKVDKYIKAADKEATATHETKNAKDVDNDDNAVHKPGDKEANGTPETKNAKDVDNDDNDVHKTADKEATATLETKNAKDVDNDDNAVHKPADKEANVTAETKNAKYVDNDDKVVHKPADKEDNATPETKNAKDVDNDDDVVHKPAYKEANVTAETKNGKVMNEGTAIDKGNKEVRNNSKYIQNVDANMEMKGTYVCKADLAIVKADVEVKKTNKEMKTDDDAWTRDVDNALIAMVAREGLTLKSTHVNVAPEKFTVKERNDICSYWTEKLDLNREKYRGLLRDVAYFGSM